MTKRNPPSDDGRTPSCAHHWKVGPPIDGVSRGICSLCGAKREFSDVWRPG